MIYRSISSRSKYGNVAIATTAVEVTTEASTPASRARLMVMNLAGSDTTYLGLDDDVTDAVGYPLAAGSSVDLDLEQGQAIYAICGAAESANLRVIEVM